MAATRLLHLSDTHLGYAQYDSQKRKEDFTDAFVQAIDRARRQNVDAIVHTGDVTHHSDTHDQFPNRAWDALEKLAADGIPFYLVVGNHDLTSDGEPQDWIDTAVDEDLCTRLGRTPEVVGDVSLYGIDYHQPEWWAEGPTTLDLDPPNPGTSPILCLHQSVTPIAPEYASSTDLSELLSKTTPSFDAVLLGHSHYTQASMVADVPAFYAGSTERTTRSYRDEPTVINEFSIDEQNFDWRVHNLDTRPFQTYTVALDRGTDPAAVYRALKRIDVENTVVTSYVATETGNVDPTAVEHHLDERGAIDATCREVDLPVELPAGIYEGSPDDLAHLSKDDDIKHEDLLAVSLETKRQLPETSRTAGTGETPNDGPRVLHLGSVHLSSANVTTARRREFRRAFEATVETAIEREVDAVVQTGKLFATRSPVKRDVTFLERSLTRLREADITFVHVGSERDADMPLVDELEADGLMVRPGATPVVLGDTAIYGIPPVDNRGVWNHLADLEAPPDGVERTLVAGPWTTSPPVDDGDLDLDNVIDALDIRVDTFLFGGSRNKRLRSITPGAEPDVFVAGPTELELRKRLLRKQPEYPCTVGILRRDGAYEPVELHHRNLVVYHVRCPPDADLQAIQTQIDPTDKTVLVGLRGEFSATHSFDVASLEDWLESHTEVCKVWDDRNPVADSDDIETNEEVTVSIHYPDVERPVDRTGESVTELSAVPEEPTESAETTAGDGGEDASPDLIADDGCSTSTTATDADAKAASHSGKSTVDAPTPAGVELPEPYVDGAGTKVDPATHLAGAALEAAGYAAVKSTDDESCGYRLDFERLNEETDQRVTLDEDDGVWECPHPAPEGTRCIFHQYDADATSVQEAFLNCLADGYSRSREFVGASFPTLALSHRILGNGDQSPIDFRFASVEGDFELDECVVSAPLKLDGARLDGEFRIDSGQLRASLSARETWFRDDLRIRFTTFEQRPVLYGALVEGQASFDDSTFKAGLTVGYATYGDGLTLRRSRSEGQFSAYNIDVGGRFQCQRAIFRQDVRLRRSSFRNDVCFNSARCESFIDLKNAVFDETATFDCETTRISDELRLYGTTLGKAYWREMTVTGAVLCAGTVVRDEVYAKGAIFEGGIQTDDDRSEDSELVVHGDLTLVKSKIENDVEIDLQIAGSLDGSQIRTTAPIQILGRARNLDFTEAVFENDVTISANVDDCLDLSMCQINGDLSLQDGSVEGSALLANTTIEGELEIVEFDITGDAVELGESRLHDTVRIRGATLPSVQAADCQLTNALLVRSATCDSFDLSRATIGGRVECKNFDIDGTFSLGEATLNEPVSIEIDEQTTNELPGGELSASPEDDGKIDHDEPRCEIRTFDATGAVFGKRITVSVDVDLLTLDRSQAVRDVDLSGITADQIRAERAKIEGDLDVSAVTADEISVDNAHIGGELDCTRTATDAFTLGTATVSEARLDRITPATEAGSRHGVTIDAHGIQLDDGKILPAEDAVYYDLTDATLGPVQLERDANTPDEASYLRRFRLYRTEYDGFRFDQLPGLGAANYDLHEFDGTPAGDRYSDTSPAGLETTYRRAKNGAAAVGNTKAEGEFFVKEMRQRRRRHSSRGDHSALAKNQIWRWTAGYGERPSYVFMTSGIAVVFFGFLFPVARTLQLLSTGNSFETVAMLSKNNALLPGQYGSPGGWFLLSFESFTTLVLGGTSVSNPILRWIAAVEGFVGAFLIALFLFTLTKAVDR